MRKGYLAVLAVAVVGAGAGGWYGWFRGLEKPPVKPPVFDGVRSRAAGVVYTHEDPVTGLQLVIRAETAVTRDGKVGKLFRTPLKPEVELGGVEAEVRSADGRRVLWAKAPQGLYDPRRGGVKLTRPRPFRVGDAEVEAEEVRLGEGGQVRISGGYRVLREGSPVAAGRQFEGPAEKLVAPAAQGSAGGAR